VQYYIRRNIVFKQEIKELIIADLALTLAFSLVMIGGIGGLAYSFSIFLYFIPISFIGVSLSFILHEMMHKFTAEKYGAMAGFRTSPYGLAITLLTSFFGFLFGIPGATMIYTNSFTRREDGIVSLAGPLTNFTIFIFSLIIGFILFPHFLPNVLLTFSIDTVYKLSFIQNILNMILFISIVVAFFNMLPIFPLDGSKILRWSKPVYFATLLATFIFFLLVIPIISFIIWLFFMLLIAYIFSTFYRGLL